MTVRVSGHSVVALRSLLEEHYPGGVAAYSAECGTTASFDDLLVAVPFEDHAAAMLWLERLVAAGLDRHHLALVEPDSAADAFSWLDIQGAARERFLTFHDPETVRPFRKHELLSRSDSGLNYVRERKSGLVRVLTEGELQDFSENPKPCEKCGEQFGCEHYNCAGEPLLSEVEIAVEVPAEWLSFARDAGISREDLLRIQKIDRRDGEYLPAVDAPTDMRLLELVLLLNDAL